MFFADCVVLTEYTLCYCTVQYLTYIITCRLIKVSYRRFSVNYRFSNTHRPPDLSALHTRLIDTIIILCMVNSNTVSRLTWKLVLLSRFAFGYSYFIVNRVGTFRDEKNCFLLNFNLSYLTRWSREIILT